SIGWSILTVIALVWFVISFGLKQPRYLSSIILRLPEANNQNTAENWTAELLDIHGIEEVVVMAEQKVAYVKLDKKIID
ncbi:MFS transporter, partial [Pseudomonas syringae]